MWNDLLLRALVAERTADLERAAANYRRSSAAERREPVSLGRWRFRVRLRRGATSTALS